jgi:hypothetical protein
MTIGSYAVINPQRCAALVDGYVITRSKITLRIITGIKTRYFYYIAKDPKC